MAGNETLDPTEPQNNSSYSHEALLAIYDPLIRLDDAGVPAPGLAESWTRNENLTELTLTLRHGVTFHDGTLFNAEAVKRNFERSTSLGRRAGNTVSETFSLISALEFHGDDVVRLKLKAPNPEQWEVVGDFYSYEPYGMAMRKNDSDFRAVVNNGLMDGIESGRFFEIYDKWFGPKGELPYPMSPAVRSFMILLVVPK